MVLECLIKCGANVNVFDKVCTNPSRWVIVYHYVYFTTLKNKFTPLHCAAQEGHCMAMEYLIACGVDFNVCNKVRIKLLDLLATHLVS